MDTIENLDTQTIKHIDENSVRQIVAGQAIFDLSSAVKELIENALDAKAKNIIIRLHQNGIEKIQVEDDGEGVPKLSRPFLATKHATSKISKFEDLLENHAHTTQLGFRGEALFCLANLSEKLEITTKTLDDRVGQKLNFLKDGSLDTETVSNIPRKIGTTVSVHKLFDALPVRRTDFIKRIRTQRAKMLKMMQGYAIMCLGVKFTLMDVKGKAGTNSFKTDIKLATSIKSHKFEDTVSSVMGSKFLAGLCRFSLDLTNIITLNGHEENTESKMIGSGETAVINSKNTQDDDSADSKNEILPNKKENLLPSSHTQSYKIEGMISKSPFNIEISSSSSNSKTRSHGVARELQFFSLNKRLVDLPNIARVLADAWREFETNQSKRPACVLALNLPNSMIDVNLSPDKREVLLQQENVICEALKEALVNFWKDQSKGTFVANEVEMTSNNFPSEKIQPNMDQFTFPLNTKNTMEAKKNRISSHLVSPADKEDDLVCEQAKEKRALTLKKYNDNVHENKYRQNKESELQRNYSQNKITASDKEMQEWTKIRSQFNSPSSFSSPQEEDINKLSPAIIFKNDELKNRRSRIRELVNSSNGKKRSMSQVQPISNVTNTKRTKLSFANQVQMLQKLKSKHGKRKDNSKCDMNNNVQSETEIQSEIERDKNDFSTFEKHSDIKDEESSPIIWESFKGTDHVMKHARNARIKARKYRKHLQQLHFERQYPANGDQLLSMKKNGEDFEYSPISLHSQDKSSNSKHVRLQKEDFLSMEIIGQFNLGFIIARCRNNHLWMLDQHACDEKYNFERLCETTVIHEQKLISPLPLELSPSEENCVMDNMDIFELNGFRFSYDEHKPIRHKLSLTGLPHSGSGGDGKKAVQFGKEDVTALCAMLGADGDFCSSDIASTSGTGADGSGMQSNHAVKRYAGTSLVSRINKNEKLNESNGISVVRLPKAIAMFASRSCRSSVMIGTALSRNEMESITRKLYHVEQPWDCPHGRPTMRHAKDILECLLKSEESAARHVANSSLVIFSQLEHGKNDFFV